MPFWLQESKLMHFLRCISPRSQIFISVLSLVVVLGLLLLYRNYATREIVHVGLAPLQSSSITETVVQPVVERAFIELRLVPQVLHFFSSLGLYPQRIERLTHNKTQGPVGYLVVVRGSFDALYGFLKKAQGISPLQMQLYTIERVDDATLDIEFFMPGGEG